MTGGNMGHNIIFIQPSFCSRLVEKLDNMKKNAMGNGSTQCVLCGDEFGLLGASPTFCDDCRKVSTVGNRSTQCVLCGD